MLTGLHQQERYVRVIVLLLSITSWVHAGDEFVISDLEFDEYNPCVEGQYVVWQAWNLDYLDWDAYGADIEDTNHPVFFEVSASPGDEVQPKLSQGTVIWQHLFFGVDDWDILGQKLDRLYELPFVIAGTIDEDEVSPAISGSNVVWQHKLRAYSDWDIHMADITDPLSPVYRTLAASADNEMAPTISGSLVVWKYDSRGSGEFHVAGADISDANEPRPFYTFQTIGEESRPVLSQRRVVGLDRDSNGDIFADYLYDPFLPELIAGQTSANVAQPAMARHIVVWQDKRNGNWDIYGYNLATGREFRITDDPSDQGYPAIAASGEACFTVVWEDDRNGNWDIYGEQICDDRVAGCLSTAPYDINKDCRVDFRDFALLAEHWLE